MAIAIRAEALSKQYRLGAARSQYTTLRDTLADSARAAAGVFRSFWRAARSSPENRSLIWALRDVSFEVEQGDVVGIIGRNGAGKSTLLKVLTRITRPTTGYAAVRGRVGSLLEVGTGFHPELTGRENVLLNGAILGMRRAEMRTKFDEIVGFAEVEEFIDTPVKHYSSGMYMRLAFAVAAFLETEILIVDEVLAVGDAEFQKKCLGRMNDVAHGGRTVLFVSHNMTAIQGLCSRCLLLDRGGLVSEGGTADVVGHYLAMGAGEAAAGVWVDLSSMARSGSGKARFEALRYSSGNQAIAFQPYQRGPLDVDVAIVSASQRSSVSIAVSIRDRYGTKLINADTDTLGTEVTLPSGSSTWRFSIERLYLKPGIYILGLWLADRVGEAFDRAESALLIEVTDIEPPPPGSRIDPRYDGVVTCPFGIERLE